MSHMLLNSMKTISKFLVKHFKKLLNTAFTILFIIVLSAGEKNKNISFLNPVFELDATISAVKNNICIDESLTITFEATGGEAPYRFIYKINGTVRPRVISENNSNTVSFIFEESDTGDYEIELISVQDKDGEDDSTLKEFTDKKVIVTVNEPPTVNFSFDNDICANESIQFTSAESGNGDFTYLWNFGDGITSTRKDPTHTFNSAVGCGTENFDVTLTVTDRFGCSTSRTKTITVKEKPDIAFTDASFGNFNNCGNASPSEPNYNITVANNSNSTCITSYSIDWGDGNTEDSATFPANHTYTQIGVYALKIKANGENGCENEVSYEVKNVSNPAGGFESPGNTSNLCPTDSELTFGITNYELNSFDTTYTVNFGDGSSTETYTQEEVQNKNTITHNYEKGSCDQVNGQFIATLSVQNACATTQFTVNNITILEGSEAEFDFPNSNCANTDIRFTNSSKIGDNLNCTKAANFRWDFGDGTVINDNSTNALNNQTHSYTTPGTYTVTLSVSSRCGSDTFTKEICIEPEVTAQFSVDNQEGCTPLNVTTTNTVDVSDLCSAPEYKWSVSYNSDNCGSTSDWEYADGTDEASENPKFLFKNPGKYSVTQNVITSCGSETSTQIIDVKKPPTVTIDVIQNFCDSATINPIATVENCTTNTGGISYNWTFTGGTPTSANTLNPGEIVYNTPGTYEVSLEVTSECGTSNKATQTFEVFEKPVITNTNTTQEICSGQNTTEFVFNQSSYTFSWTAVSSGNITGFIQNGTVNNIPAQRLINTGSNIETVTYTVIPSLGICDGDPLNFVVTVNPAPLITTQPESSETCINGNPTLLEVAFTNSIGTPEYQWFSNTTNSNSGGTPINGETSSSYRPTSDTANENFYYVEISFSSGGCGKIVSDVARVNIVEQLTIDAVSPPQTLCIGGSIDELTVTSNDGTGNFSYQWYSNTVNTNSGGTVIAGATNNTYTPPIFTTDNSFYYYVEISSDDNGCSSANSDVFQITIVPKPIIDAEPIASQELCQNATPTDLTVSDSGGSSAAKEYQWYINNNNSNSGGTPINGANSNSYTPPTNNTGAFYYYVVIVQPESGCEITSQTSALTVNEAPIFTNQPLSEEICVNGSASMLAVDYINGTGTPSYQWFTNTTNTTIGGTPIDSETNSTFSPSTNTVGETFYYAEISFTTGGCSKITSDIARINVVNQLITDAVEAPQTICVDGIADEFQVTFSGGTGTPSYKWFSNTINSNIGGTLIGNANGNNYTPPPFSNTGDFFFYAEVSLDSNGCSTALSDTFQVNVISKPTIDSQPIVAQELCQGSLPANLTITASGGTSSLKNYQWYINTNNSNTGGNLINGATSNSYTPSTNNIGTFYYYAVVTQTESGCETKSQISTLTVNEAPIFKKQPSSSEICINENATLLEVEYTNGTGIPTYQWFSNTFNSNTNGTPITGATTASYNPSTNTVGTTFYYSEISFSSGGCSKINSNVASVIINEIPVISDDSITIYSEATFNYNPNSIAGNIVPNGTKYTWATPTYSPTGAIIGATAETTPQEIISQTLVNTSTTPIVVTYTITSETAKCFGNAFTLEVTVNPNISSNTIVINNSCFEANDGEITTNIEGGIPFSTGNPYLISWSGPNGFSSTNTTLTNLQAGLYVITIEDSTGFSITEEWNVTQPNLLTISRDLVQNISCFQGNDGIINLTVSGGTENYTYNWTTTNGSGIIFGNKNQNTLTAGTYILEVVDKNNCISSETFMLTEPEGLNIATTSKQDILCFGDATGAISINVTGGTKVEISPGNFDYMYSWSGPGGFSSSSKNINNVIAGTYTVAVTDNLNCTTSTSIDINQSPEIIINVTTTDVSCYGEADGTLEVNVTGGSGSYQISWSNFANGFSQSNLTAETYIATITDGNNCVKEVSITINQPIFFIDPDVQPISCNGANDGAIDLNLTGGINPITITWNDDPSAGVQRNNLAAGTYTVSIIDSDPKQCPIEQTFIFTNPPAIAVSSTVTDAIDCTIANSGIIDITVSGGTEPLEFTWSNGATTEDLENIPQGDYSVVIKDANGCSITQQFSIFRQDPIEIEFIESFITNCDTKTVTKKIEAKTSGGFLPHTLSWSSGTVSGQNNEMMTTNQTGAYVLTVTDDKGCVQTKSILIDEIPTIGDPDFRYNAFALTNYDFLSIKDPIQFTNLSSGNYTNITWSFGDGSLPVNEENPIHTYDTVGSYTVTQTVEYESGCTYTAERNIDITVGYNLINPTAFTPNGDGYNDTIRPNFTGFTEIEMNIYDTWGTLIYHEKGTSLNGWNGNIKNTPAENGNYIMVVKGIVFYNKEISSYTPVTLLK